MEYVNCLFDGFLFLQPLCRNDPSPSPQPKTTLSIKPWAWANWRNWQLTTIQIRRMTFHRRKKRSAKRGTQNTHWEVISMGWGRWRSILRSRCWLRPARITLWSCGIYRRRCRRRRTPRWMWNLCIRLDVIQVSVKKKICI